MVKINKKNIYFIGGIIEKYIFFLIGIILISLSITFQILYLNLLTLEFSFLEYLLFIFKRIEVLIIIPGIFILIYNIKRRR